MIDRNKHFPVLHWPGHWAIGHWPRLEAVIEYIRSLALLNSPAAIVRELLVLKVLGSMPSSGSEWPVFVSHLPDGDDLDNAICVYDTVSRLHGETPDGISVEHKGVTLSIRSSVYTVGKAKLAELIDFLDALSTEVLTLGVNRYEVDNAVQEVVDFGGYDGQRRSLFFSYYSVCLYRLVQA